MGCFAYCSMQFYSHEDFNSIFEKFGKGQKEFSFTWLGFEDISFSSLDPEDNSPSFSDETENKIGFMCRSSNYGDVYAGFRKIATSGIDFIYSVRLEGGSGEKGYFKDGRWFITKHYDDNEVLNDELQDLPDGKFDWTLEMYTITKEKIQLNSIVKNLNFAWAIVSEISDTSVKLSVIEDKDDTLISGNQIIAEYKNIEELTKDGWVLDLSQPNSAN